MERKKVWITAESFKAEETDKGIIVRGLALPFGKRSRNGATYNKERIIEIADTLKNKPLLFNHDETKIIGHTTENITIKDDGLYYEADIDPQEEYFVRKIKRGDIRNVSIQGIVDKVGENNEVFLSEFLELSMVTIPGFKDTNVTTLEKLLEEREKEKGKIAEPFAGYKDFQDCVKKNQDKDSPEGFCAWLHKKATGDWPSESFEGKETLERLEKIGYFGDTYKEAEYPWDQCIRDMKKRGYDEETAQKICAAIKNRSIKHLLDTGLADNPITAIKIIEEIISYNKNIFNKYQRKQDINMKEEDKQEEEEKKEEETAQEDYKDILEKIVSRLDKIEEELKKVKEKQDEEEKEEEAEESVASKNVPKMQESLDIDELRRVIAK